MFVLTATTHELNNLSRQYVLNPNDLNFGHT